jgi:hypothetical protein
MASLGLAAETLIFPCANCGTTIDTDRTQCPACGAEVDAGAAAASAAEFARVNQAISDASSLKIMAGCALGFFFLRLVPLLGLLGIAGFLFLEFAIPFMTIRWWVKFRDLRSQDLELLRARRTVIYFGAGVSVLFVLLYVGALVL